MPIEVRILYVDAALTATELRRLCEEFNKAAHSAAGLVVAVNRIDQVEGDALAGLVELLENPPDRLHLALIITGHIGREQADRLLAIEVLTFATPRAEVALFDRGGRPLSGLDLSLAGLAELVRSPRHAADRLAVLCGT